MSEFIYRLKADLNQKLNYFINKVFLNFIFMGYLLLIIAYNSTDKDFINLWIFISDSIG